ncbi:aldehyde dehydrogenase family protein, partial [uncultured Sphingomonas sp.]|uniref:aldehyde dehydrogenase family protein n=1 Tax=uncultured Sphingomonas sp. TaxID=158754 RepID=UPI0025E6F513
MQSYLKHYINGEWVDSNGGRSYQVIDPAIEQPCTEITLGTPADVDHAVAAARAAFDTWSQTSVDERKAVLT